jgi:hypothetical protein
MMTWNVRGYRHAPLIVVAAVFLLVAGCADLTVTKVTDSNNATVAGVRYYLPKPYLQVTPQADGTISVDVVYLPDKTHAYAIATSSKLSSYTFQVSRDEKGLLTAIEYKASTTAVGQQLAASTGAAAVQAYNIRAAQQAAVQTQVNTAAAAVDTANATLQAANAALASDQAHGVQNLASDYNAVNQAAAKLQAAQQALQRVQTTAQAVSTSVASGTAASTTAPQMGNLFGQPTWNTAAVASLPSKFGPVLFAINDTVSGRVESVTLKAVTSSIPQSELAAKDELEDGVVRAAQPTFETVATALGPPTLFPLTQSVRISDKVAKVVFSRAICIPSKDCSQPSAAAVYKSPSHEDVNPKNQDPKKVGTLGNDYRTFAIDITKLSPGDYEIDLTFTYPVAPSQLMGPVTQKVKFTVTK